MPKWVWRCLVRSPLYAYFLSGQYSHTNAIKKEHKAQVKIHRIRQNNKHLSHVIGIFEFTYVFHPCAIAYVFGVYLFFQIDVHKLSRQNSWQWVVHCVSLLINKIFRIQGKLEYIECIWYTWKKKSLLTGVNIETSSSFKYFPTKNGGFSNHCFSKSKSLKKQFDSKSYKIYACLLTDKNCIWFLGLNESHDETWINVLYWIQLDNPGIGLFSQHVFRCVLLIFPLKKIPGHISNTNMNLQMWMKTPTNW